MRKRLTVEVGILLTVFCGSMALWYEAQHPPEPPYVISVEAQRGIEKTKALEAELPLFKVYGSRVRMD